MLYEWYSPQQRRMQSMACNLAAKDGRNSVLFSQGTNTEYDVLFPVDGNAVLVHGILILEEKVFLIQQVECRQ